MDQNIEAAAKATEDAEENLRDSDRQVRSSRSAYCVLLLCLAGTYMIASTIINIASVSSLTACPVMALVGVVVLRAAL